MYDSISSLMLFLVFVLTWHVLHIWYTRKCAMTIVLGSLGVYMILFIFMCQVFFFFFVVLEQFQFEAIKHPGTPESKVKKEETKLLCAQWGIDREETEAHRCCLFVLVMCVYVHFFIFGVNPLNNSKSRRKNPQAAHFPNMLLLT